MTDTTERPTVASVRSALPKTIGGRGYAVWALYELERKAHHGDTAYRAGYIAQGIAWSLETGRLLTPAHRAVTALNRAGLARLVIDAERACEVVGDVPYWLNARYGRMPA